MQNAEYFLPVSDLDKNFIQYNKSLMKKN